VGVAAAAAFPVAAVVAVAAFRGQVEEVTPDQVGVVTPDQAGVGVASPGHLALRGVLTGPAWSARGLLPISTEEVAAEFLPQAPVRARDLPGNDWPTAHLNYLRRAGPTVLQLIARLAVARASDPRRSPLARVPGLGKGLPIGLATGTWAIS
jgi:hypothetical protein